MHKLYFILLLFLTSDSFSQRPPKKDSVISIFSADFLKTRRIVDSTLHPIKYAKTLDELLFLSFPKKTWSESNWEFYSGIANIGKIIKPAVKAVIPNFEFYKIRMISHLGYHIIQGNCLVLVDSLNSNTILASPLWYTTKDKTFFKLFLNQKFSDKNSLLAFITQLNELLQIGSIHEFWQTSYSDSLITYDLVHLNGDSFNRSYSNKESVWRKIKIEIKDFTVIRFSIINPEMNDVEIVE